MTAPAQSANAANMPPDKKDEGKNKFVGFRAPKSVIEQATAAAKEDNRSLSNYILNLIAEDLARAESENRRAAEDPPGYHAPPKKDNGGGQGKLTA